MNRDDALIWLSRLVAICWFAAICGATIWVILNRYFAESSGPYADCGRSQRRAMPRLRRLWFRPQAARWYQPEHFLQGLQSGVQRLAGSAASVFRAAHWPPGTRVNRNSLDLGRLLFPVLQNGLWRSFLVD